MPRVSVRHLYLTRHGEPDAAGGLTDRGREQAAFLGRRLSAAPSTPVVHGPSPRAAETARVVAAQFRNGVPVAEAHYAGDDVPYIPTPDEIDPESRAGVLAFLADVSPDEAAEGAALAAEAIRWLTGPEPGEDDTHQLVVTHAFTIGWLVRHAHAAPPWRWVGIDHAHAALTVLRFFPDRPPTTVVFNDMSHLPAGLRWTGLSDQTRP